VHKKSLVKQKKRGRKAGYAAAATLLAMTGLHGAFAAQTPVIESAPKSSAAVQQVATNVARRGKLGHKELIGLLRQKIKYVFVIFQENRSFDSYFGTYPGANGLFWAPRGQTPGNQLLSFNQPIENTDGSIGTISPFRIPFTMSDGTNVYPQDTDSVNHGHTAIDTKLDFDQFHFSHNDKFALVEEGFSNGIANPSAPPTLAAKQKGELVMSYVDCNTIPFLWQYADRFTLFDNFHMTIIGPSTPNAIAIIAGQSGETQWALHPETGINIVGSGVGEPVTGDPGPFPGSNLDLTGGNVPFNPGDENPNTPTRPQTYATLPLSFMGKDATKITNQDLNPVVDLLDVEDDIKTITGTGKNPINWAWYQQGYDHEGTSPGGPGLDAPNSTTHSSYIVHHEGPQYFGYIGDNNQVNTHLRGLGDFFTDVAGRNLPGKGGVFYIRGGYGNIGGFSPVDPKPSLATVFNGNDDHPGYSDAQISEALVAQEINAIAASPYWKDSAIIITYDETDGLFDHAPVRPRSSDALGFPLAGGQRIPTIVISPYSASHTISHKYSEHSSIIKFVDHLFDLIPLADLPDEVEGREAGLQEFGQANLGPADDKVNPMGDLSEAFDVDRLTGKTPPLPSSYATIPTGVISSFPHYSNNGCFQLNIVPTDANIPNPVPVDFNPRPGSDPGLL
jgi:phospholipase C